MRIPPKPVKDYPWYVRVLFRIQRRRYGAVLDPARLWGRSPALLLTLSALYGVLDRRRSPIDPMLRSLVTVRVSQINWCPFCVDVNAATLLQRGAAPTKLQALATWRGSDLFDDRERAALDYAESITRSDAEVDDALMNRVKRHFDDDAVVELTALIAFQNMSSKFNAALGVPPQGFCTLSTLAVETKGP